MDEIKRLTPAQRARCNRLIRRLCANYDGGNCLPLDDGEGCVCVQMISYSLLCKYFRRAVLPTDKARYPLAMPASSERAVRFYSRQSRSAKTLVRACPKTPKEKTMKVRTTQ